MNNLDLTLEIDRKKEYTKQVVSILNIRIYEGIHKIYNNAKKLSNKNNNNNYLNQFQKLLCLVPNWDKQTIVNEFERIKKKSNCNFLEELITAVFLSHTKVLTAIKGNSQFNLEIPNGSKFLHRCYIECARIFWKNPYLYSDVDISPCEYQRNLRDCENIISKTIVETIRKMLPVENILKEYLGNSYKKNDANDSISITNMIDHEKDNLKSLVQQDLQSSNIMKPKELNNSYSMYINKENNTEIKNNSDNSLANKQDVSIEKDEIDLKSITNTETELLEENNNLNETENKLKEESVQSKDKESTKESKELINAEDKESRDKESRDKEVINNIDNLLESMKTSYEKSNNKTNKINNLDILSENNVEGTRIKDKKQTLSILKNSEKTRRRNRKYNSYLIKDF